MSISKWQTLFTFNLPFATTYGDMRPGCTDRGKRKRIREAAIPRIPGDLSGVQRWGFRIHVFKSGKGCFDIENVPKLILDAFCRKQIDLDDDALKKAGLYPDDTIDHVGYMEVAGSRTEAEDRTLVEVLGELPEP